MRTPRESCEPLVGASPPQEAENEDRNSETPNIPLGHQAFRMSGISGEELLEVGGGLVIFNDNVGLAVPTHPHLFELNLRGFVRRV